MTSKKKKVNSAKSLEDAKVTDWRKTNCDKCVFASYYDEDIWACMVGGFRDYGSKCNIMTDKIISVGKNGEPNFEWAFIDKSKLTKEQVRKIIQIVKEEV